MKKMALVVLIMLSVSANAQNKIVGRWDRTIDTPKGKKTAEMIIEMQGDEIIAITSKKSFEIKMEGDSVFWDQSISTLIGKIKVSNKGILKGDKLSGLMVMKSGPKKGKEISWVAVRKDD